MQKAIMVALALITGALSAVQHSAGAGRLRAKGYTDATGVAVPYGLNARAHRQPGAQRDRDGVLPRPGRPAGGAQRLLQLSRAGAARGSRRRLRRRQPGAHRGAASRELVRGVPGQRPRAGGPAARRRGFRCWRCNEARVAATPCATRCATLYHGGDVTAASLPSKIGAWNAAAAAAVVPDSGQPGPTFSSAIPARCP